MIEKYQTKYAKVQLLYKKEWRAHDETPHTGGQLTDRVFVELVGWAAHGFRETLIMTSAVMVNSKDAFEARNVLDCGIVEAIDKAAKQYADLLKAHPGYAPNNEPEQSGE